MGVLAVLIIVPIMLFALLVVELFKSNRKVKRLETVNNLLEKRYDGLVAKVQLIAHKDAIEMTPYVYQLAKELKETNGYTNS